MNEREGAAYVVDVEKVPLFGDVSKAIVRVPEAVSEERSYDVVVAGGGLGGVAATLAIADAGLRVCLLEETAWIGGQATAQGVSALDEHPWIEQFGGTRRYIEFRERIRAHYSNATGATPAETPLNPGECWVSTLAFEPEVGLAALEAMLAPYIEEGLLDLFTRVKVFRCGGVGSHIEYLDAVRLESGVGLRLFAPVIIDATEMGDLLPLSETPYRLGAESRSDTGEPHAPDEPIPNAVQGCTYPFVLELASQSQPPIPRPPAYEHLREHQPYSLSINIHGKEGRVLDYAFFDRLPGTPGSVWDYRRVRSKAYCQEGEAELSMLNWPGNDYYGQALPDLPPHRFAEALQEAKQLSIGFAHWLQTECDDSRDAHLGLCREVMGTEDGLSRYPYIREGRRIVALRPVLEQDVSPPAGARAQQFADAVGVGLYALDVHHTCHGAEGFFVPVKPFQIPLGALIPKDERNLIAGAKNIGVTHVTNGCYRLHPVEWNIGEAAGVLAAYCAQQNVTPAAVWKSRRNLRRVQLMALERGMPTAWLVDIPPVHPHFVAAHWISTIAEPPDADSLEFQPEAPLTRALYECWMAKARVDFPTLSLPYSETTRGQFAAELLLHSQSYL